MNALAQWNQYREMEALHRSLGSLFSRSPVARLEGQEETMRVADWTPLVDISEDDKEYLIKAELPEVKKEDVKVTAEEGTLTIMGERKFEKEEKNKKYHRVERAYGSFGRSFSFPDDASPGGERLRLPRPCCRASSSLYWFQCANAFIISFLVGGCVFGPSRLPANGSGGDGHV